ncbi:MAG TPA: ABC transporter ATP-binding protein/permease [Pseudomonadales bacterium]|nr:ABC transporter ATP-binding protein/permease [Pseudomonadales bacterium]MDP6314673.1 ABC transporter ATP-binding protein/permease [Pseudomonadales bacterium]MDP7313236.1 ABC transporter ATP-binding protein/permease [Pseudomonadales bacterium]MDP7575702.1 ABC transporter ATP-binding protein/permease [Pseudomonadales bacterium]HJL60723.1 ABC transporter ATP-binding protein/permease [Pseudomonadales bacterium]
MKPLIISNISISNFFLSSTDWQTLRLLVPFFSEYRSRILLALGILIAVTAASLTLPFLLKMLVDGLDSTNQQLIALPLALIAAYSFVRFAAVALRELTLAIYGTVTVRAMRRVSLNVLQHLHQLDLDYHLSRRTGAITRDMDRGVSAIAALLRILTFQILNMFLGVGGVTIVLFTVYHWSYAAIILVAVVFYSTYTVKVTAWRTPFIRESNDANSRANTRAVDSLINYETVKYFGNEAVEANQYDADLTIWENARRRNRYSLAGLNAGQSFFVHAGMFGMMLLAAWEVIQGQLTVGDLVAINAFAVQVFMPLNQLGGIYRELKRCFTDVERMFDILNSQPSIRTSPNAKILKSINGSIRFSNVTFSYDGKRNILDSISFVVKPKQKVALVGASGAGKSTIARLLFRFYDIHEGSIEIDDHPIKEIELDSLRQAFGIVPQDATLFNSSLYENIHYGDVTATEDLVTEAAYLANLDGLISRLPDGMETVVGERGLKLSGGEKQRVAIARAILKRPTFLVFDEATSSLDSVSENAIMDAIDNVSEGHTTLIIAHRLSTIVNADKIIVIDEGKVAESGTHTELLMLGGLYRQLWDTQQQELQPESTVPAAVRKL